MRILVFGASIDQGFYDPEGGWVGKLWKEYAYSGYDPQIINLSLSGETSANLLQRISSEIKPRLKDGYDNAIIISIGGNDSAYSDDEVKCTTEEFRENIKGIHNASRKHVKKIMFLGIAPVVDEMVQPMPWAESWSISNERRGQFDDIVQEFATQNDCEYVSLRNVFRDKNLKDLMVDGNHPNSKGHKLIANAVKPVIEKWTKK